MACGNRISSVIVGMVLLAGGCASAPPDVPSAEQDGHRQAEAAMQAAKAESTGLRSELASARIAAAKQEADLRELRRQVEELRQMVDAKHTELIALRNERDRLVQTAMIAQVRVADPFVLPASAAEVASLRTKLREMESALAVLTAELAQMRKVVDQSSSVSKSQPAAAKPSRLRSP